MNSFPRMKLKREGLMKHSILALSLLLLAPTLPLVARGSEAPASLWATLTPNQGFAPLTVQVTSHIPPDERNHEACLILYGSEYERIHCWDLGVNDPPTSQWTFPAVPAGTYIVQLGVGRTGDKRPTYASPLNLFVRGNEDFQ